MPAVTSLSIYGAVRLSRAVAAMSGRLAHHVKRAARLIRNRRDADKLVSLDDHMLKDIGLTRFDLRDAYAEPLWRDPTDALARRACERRRANPIPDGFHRPSANRPARYLV